MFISHKIMDKAREADERGHEIAQLFISNFPSREFFFRRYNHAPGITGKKMDTRGSEAGMEGIKWGNSNEDEEKERNLREYLEGVGRK